MERLNKEPAPSRDLEKLLYRVGNNQMFQFTSTGYRLYEYVETGETTIHSMQVGESEHIFNVPVKEPILQKEAESLDELFANDDSHTYHDGHIADEIDTQEYKDWVASLIGPEDVKQAAVTIVARREVEGDSETLPCSNCKGKLQFEHPCLCTFGGVTYVDMTDDSSVSLRENGIADPECQTCDGSGNVKNDCPCCEGNGKMAKYPQIILHNEMTGEQRILKLDLAQLIENDELDVEWAGSEKLYPNDYQVGEKLIRFNVARYIERQLVEMGIDIHNSVRTTQYGISVLELERQNVITSKSWWRKFNGNVEKSTHDGSRSRNRSKEKQTASDILVNAQQILASHHARGVKDDTGLNAVQEWYIRPLRSIEDTLTDIQVFLAHHNYTLGFTMSFIGTGEVGPSFYVLDSNGTALSQLSCSYYVREALENAWLALQEFTSQR